MNQLEKYLESLNIEEILNEDYNNESSNDDDNDDNDEYSGKREEEFGKCPICNRYNTSDSWCQSCDPQLLTEGWTSGNKTIDKLIKNTQLKVTEYDNSYYLQWIPYDKLKDIEKIDESHFATIYHAIWINGWKYIDKQSKERIIKDRYVALKKL